MFVCDIPRWSSDYPRGADAWWLVVGVSGGGHRNVVPGLRETGPVKLPGPGEDLLLEGIQRALAEVALDRAHGGAEFVGDVHEGGHGRTRAQEGLGDLAPSLVVVSGARHTKT
ncbi:hypothetical protein GCM10007079_03170 [Nocardiopsis terrae]|nr:hypothetical protein GCM10007079_03170 [Nocardiopsis terrae]